MDGALILASGSVVRRQLLTAANVTCEPVPARIDEEAARTAMVQAGAGPRDVADALAEMKARKVSDKRPGVLVLGCDQVLDFEGDIVTKATSPEMQRDTLLRLRGKRHALLSAAVIYSDGEPLWRHVGVARLTMRAFSDAYLDAYLARNGADVAESVGGYKLEAEGVRLFSRIEGDYFTILGLPLLEILSYLALRGEIPS